MCHAIVSLSVTSVPCDCLSFTTVPWNCPSGSPLFRGIVHAVHHCVSGFIPPVHHCAMRLSLCHSWDCRSGSARRARHDPLGSPLRRGIYQSASPLCHGLVFLWFTTVSWDCPSGSQLCHGTAPPAQHCVTGLSLRFSPVSWGCPSDSQLWFCPTGSSPSHGTDPLVHRYVMGLLVWFTSLPCGIVPLVRRRVTGLFLGYTALSWDSPLISPLYYGIAIRSTAVPWCKPSSVHSDFMHQIIWHLIRILC